MAVLLPGKFIFLAQPHTASSAMCLALQDVFPDAYDLRPHHMSLADVKGELGATRLEHISQQRTRIWKPGGPRSGMTHSSALPTMVRGLITGREHVFGVVRNPYDFLATCFARRGHGKAFLDFVKNFREDPYVRDGRIYYHDQDCDTLLRYENLQPELNALMRRLDLPEVPLGRHNETQNKQPWETYYTPEAFETVNERFGEEAARFYDLKE